MAWIVTKSSTNKSNIYLFANGNTLFNVILPYPCIESGGADSIVVGNPQLHCPPSYLIICEPECNNIALTNTPEGRNDLQNIYFLLHNEFQKFGPVSEKYCRTNRAVPAAPGLAIEVPKRKVT